MVQVQYASLAAVRLAAFSMLLLPLATPPPIPAQVQSEEADAALTAEQWREDLDVLAAGMERTHRQLYHTVAREEFAEAIDDLKSRIPDLKRHEIIVEIARIVAMVGDGHTQLWLTPNTRNGFNQVPILLYWLTDGLYVLAVDERYAETAGGRVLKIGDVSTEEAMQRVRGIVHRDNEMGTISIGARYLAIPEVLHALRLTDFPARATYEVEKDGARIEVELEAIPDAWLPNLSGRPYLIASRSDSVTMAFAWDPAREAPLYISQPDNRFWYQWLEESMTLYVQLNAVLNKEHETMAAFFDRVFAEVDSTEVERLVLDLRFNGGGNNFNNDPVIQGVVKRDAINQFGKFYVIISRHTFSAASHLVTYLERNTNALFVGEPTGGSPNHFGDARPVDLPNSGLRIGASSIYWQNSLPVPFESRDWTPPQLAAEPNIDDWLAGRDPALEAILTYPYKTDLVDLVLRTLDEEGAEAAEVAFKEYAGDPRHAYLNVEQAMNTLGYELIGEGRLGEAVTVFRLNTEAYPGSANVWDSLGDGYRARGETELAVGSYRKALEIDPEFSASLANLEELLGQ
jgi:hypothetical protein